MYFFTSERVKAKFKTTSDQTEIAVTISIRWFFVIAAGAKGTEGGWHNDTLNSSTVLIDGWERLVLQYCAMKAVNYSVCMSWIHEFQNYFLMKFWSIKKFTLNQIDALAVCTFSLHQIKWTFNWEVGLDPILINRLSRNFRMYDRKSKYFVDS